MKFPARILAVTALVAGLLLPVAKGVLADSNLIANPSAETSSGGLPTGWLEGSWGANTPTFAYTTGNAEDGSHALKVSMSGYSSGDAKWYFNPVAVTAGSTYTFSDYYEATIPTDVYVQAEDANGVYSYVDLGTQPASATWAAMSSSFVVPAGDTSVTVFHVIAGNGTLTTDNYSLSEVTTTPPPPPPTAVQNPGLEQSSGGLPTDWQSNAWGTNATTFSYLNTGHTGSHSVEVSTTSYSSGDAKWYFNPITVQAGQEYLFSDYYESNISSSVVVAFTMADGSSQYLTLGSAGASSNWMQYQNLFTAPTGVQSATVYHLIAGVGHLTTDDYALSPYTSSTGGNLFANPSAEIASGTAPADWQSSSWGTNTVKFSYPTGGAHTGNRYVEVDMTKYTSGDAKWFPNPVAVTPDTQYQFSDYYKSTTATEVDVAFTLSNGTSLYQILGLPGTASSWSNFTTSFTVPLGAETMTVYHLISSVGTLSVDDESLTAYQPAGFSQALVTLTFDDGYSSTYNQGLPVLKQYGFTSTQFIITDVVGKSGYMTEAEVKALHADGDEIASHTVTHDNMLTETAAQYDNELSASKTTLQNWIGAPVTDMAYPEGLYNAAIQKATANYYTGARGVEDGLNDKNNLNAYDIKVQNVFNTTTTAQVADWIKQAQATNTWLVLVYHSVDSNTKNPVDEGIYNITPTQLTAQLSALKSSGATVVTLQAALAKLLPQK